MGKSVKSHSCNKKGRCVNHLFEIKPLQAGSYYSKKVTLRLCPKHNKLIILNIEQPSTLKTSFRSSIRTKNITLPHSLLLSKE